MTTLKKLFTAPIRLKAEGDAEGHVEAAFSVFHYRDSQGDVVLPSFFKEGQEIPMSGWSHAWASLPPGKGIIHVTDKEAVFDGSFFMDTIHGQEHYKTVKAMAGLQEWSFGFDIKDQEERVYNDPDTGKEDGVANFLIEGETFEATPTLVGAQRLTHTLAIKEGRYAPEPDAPTAASLVAGLGFAEHGAFVAGLVKAFKDRAEERLAFRQREGRGLSADNVETLGEMLADLKAAWDQVAAVLAAAEREAHDLDPVRLYNEFLEIEARLVGALPPKGD